MYFCVFSALPCFKWFQEAANGVRCSGVLLPLVAALENSPTGVFRRLLLFGGRHLLEVNRTLHLAFPLIDSTDMPLTRRYQCFSSKAPCSPSAVIFLSCSRCGEKMNAIQVISLTLLSVLAANAQVIMPGRCPKPAVQENFDAARYLGTWYEIQRLPHSFQRGQCSTATYSLKSPGVVGVLNSELLADGSTNTISGSATAKDPAEPAKLAVTFFENSPPAPYWVLSTDYDKYSLVYSCTDLGVLHVEFAWIMSKQPTMSEETIEDLHSTLSSIGVRVDKLLTTNQDTDYCSAMGQ